MRCPGMGQYLWSKPTHCMYLPWQQHASFDEGNRHRSGACREPWLPWQQLEGLTVRLQTTVGVRDQALQPTLGSTTPSGCPGGCSRPTYPSPSSTHRQFTGGREFFFFRLQSELKDSLRTLQADTAALLARCATSVLMQLHVCLSCYIASSAATASSWQ
jgi:hypothetical protein